MLATVLLALAGNLTVAPLDTTVNGVTFPGTVTLAGQRLVLNGVALRRKLFFKVYEAGLYLPRKSGNADSILAADAPRRLVMQFLRDVSKEQMCDAGGEALMNNTPDASAQLQSEFTTLCGYMADVKETQQIIFTYLPGTGTQVMIAGTARGTITGKDFADALFKTWIGPKPGPGERFKQDLLGAT